MPKHFISALLLALGLMLSCGSPAAFDYDELLAASNQSLKRGLYKDALEGYVKLKCSKTYYNKAIKGIINVYQQQNRGPELLSLLVAEEKTNSSLYLLSALGGLYRQHGSPKNSLIYYQKYLKQLPSGSKNVSKVNKIINELEFAIDLMNNPYDIEVTEVVAPVTSEYSEYSPSFTLDQKKLIFTREVQGQEDLYEAFLTDSSYTIRPIKAINTKYNEGAQAISGNGQRLIFTHCNENFGYGSCDLYESVNINGQWGAPANIGPNVNGTGWESQPSLNIDGTVLYFSSNRPGGHGGSDIWKSELDNSGVWGKPKNLGPQLNSGKNERSPFIHPDGETIYFSSDGFPSIGGYDLYVSHLRNKKWSDPMNCGTPINSPFDDNSLVVSTDGQQAYFSKQKDASLDRNIYKITLPEALKPKPIIFVRLVILDQNDEQAIQATVSITDLSLDSQLDVLRSDEKGSILTTLPIGKNLSVHINAEGYLFHSENINYPKLKYGQDPYIDTIFLNSIVGASISDIESPKITLNNIFFDSGSAEIKSESETEISYIFDLLSNDGNISVIIIGHTDNIGTPEDNLSLSLNRSIAIKQALVDMGIDSGRIQTIGRGELEPITNNDTAEGRAQNRRTELMIKRQ